MVHDPKMTAPRFFYFALAVAALLNTFSTCSARSEEGPLDYLPSNTLAAVRVGDLISGIFGDAANIIQRFGREQMGIEESAGMLASAGALSGVDLNGEIVAAITMSDRLGAPATAVLPGVFAPPRLSVLLLLPCRDVNALPMALGMVGYSPDATSGGTGGLLLVHESLPTLALSQWSPGVVAAAIGAAPLKVGEGVQGPGVCSLAASCTVVAVNGDGTIAVRAGGDAAATATFTLPAASLFRRKGLGQDDPLGADGLASLSFPMRVLRSLLEGVLPPGPLVPPSPPAQDARLRLPRTLRAAARNSAVSLLLHPPGANPALRPLLSALRAGSPLLRMAAAASLSVPQLPAAAAAAIGSLLDAAIGAGLTVLEDSDAFVLALGRSTGFDAAGRSQHASSQDNQGADAVAVHGGSASGSSGSGAGAGSGPAGIRIEAALAARRGSSLGKAIAASPVSAAWEDLLAGLPAEVPGASYVAVSSSFGAEADARSSSSSAGATGTSATSAGAGRDASKETEEAVHVTSLARRLADAAADLLSQHARALQADVSPLSRLLLLLLGDHGAERKSGAAATSTSASGISALARLLEGAQMAFVRSEPSSPSASDGHQHLSAGFGWAAHLPGEGASSCASVLRLHSELAHVAALAVDQSMPWAAGWLTTDAAVTAQVDASGATGASPEPEAATITLPLGSSAVAEVSFAAAPQRSVSGVAFERRLVRLTVNESGTQTQLGGQAPRSTSSRLHIELDLHVGTVPETHQCTLFAGLTDAAASSFVEAARARPAAVAAARAAAAAIAADRQLAEAAEAGSAGDEEGGDEAPAFSFEDAGLDPEMAAAFASAMAAAADSSKSAHDGSSKRREEEDADNPYAEAGRAAPPEATAALPAGGYSARHDAAAASRAAHVRKTSLAMLHLRSVGTAACAAARELGVAQWLADACTFIAESLIPAAPLAASTSTDGSTLSWRLAVPVPTRST